MTKTKTKVTKTKAKASATLSFNHDVRASGAAYAAALRDVAKTAKLDPIDIMIEAEGTDAVMKRDNVQFIVGWFRALQDASGATPAAVLAWFPE